MTTELTMFRSQWLRAWPCFVAGLCGPLLGFLLARWLPFHLAMGLGFFVAWSFVGLMFARRSSPKWGVPGWLAAIFAGAAAGFTVGGLWFFFP